MASNPEIRGLLKRMYHISKASITGETVMCPCGCLVKFRKRTDSHIFARKVECKTKYYNITRSKSNHAYTSKMLGVRQSIRRYISSRGFKV